MYKVENGFDLDELIYGIFISLLFFGYPIFSILATIFDQDVLTIFTEVYVFSLAYWLW